MFFKIKKFEDVHVIQMAKTVFGKPLYFVHAFYLDNLLIDTGFNDAKAYLHRFIKQYGVKEIIITHHHEDHIGGNAEANRLGIIPLVPTEGLELVTHPHKLQFYRRMIWGMPEPSRAEILSNKVESKHFTLQVIHAPGHSYDHKVFYEKMRGWLFSGDVFLAEQVKYMRDDEDANKTIETIRKLLNLDFDLMFDALRGPVKNAKTAMKNKLEFLEEKQAQAKELYDRGLSFRDITTQMFGREGLVSTVSGGHFSKMTFTKSLLGITKYPAST